MRNYSAVFEHEGEIISTSEYQAENLKQAKSFADREKRLTPEISKYKGVKVTVKASITPHKGGRSETTTIRLSLRERMLVDSARGDKSISDFLIEMAKKERESRKIAG